MTTSASQGGDAACWAHLVCDECGAVEADGHREGCPRLGTDRDELHEPE